MFKRKVLSKADHIRSMSDEELAEFLVLIISAVLFKLERPFLLRNDLRSRACGVMLELIRLPSGGDVSQKLTQLADIFRLGMYRPNELRRKSEEGLDGTSEN